MGDPAKARATYQDLLSVPSHMVAEILGGELVVSPRPSSPHARASSVLGSRIGGPFDFDGDGPGGWLILDEPELHLGPEPDVLVPDIAGWRRTRMPQMPDAPAFTLAPDWVCEVLSKSTAPYDRSIKMDIYAREGVGHSWLLDPVAKLLEVYSLGPDGWLRQSTWRNAGRVRAPPFDAIDFELSDLFSR